MDIKELQKKINEISYNDSLVNAFDINYFGDEIDVYFDNEDGTSWKISFLICDKVSYETDASREWQVGGGGTYVRDTLVRNMNRKQFGYFGQNIILSESNTFISVKMHLTSIIVELQCKKIEIDQVNNDEMNFFWKKNEPKNPKPS